ncbi:MAG: type II toxin-antitoxin system Phd/YefM family antitoxin [Desulfovibrionales bacterium]|nr:type II toxin-antitoxin system Phd/YefM family antitoxin [Desulfovibrionales bacterium]
MRPVYGLYLVIRKKGRQPMKLSSRIRPISYLKAHAAEIVRKLGEQREPLVITQNGEAKVVIQDIESYEQTQETMALLKILALGTRQIEEGKVQPAEDVIKRLRERRETR